MPRIFAPAIALLNRVGYTKKFTLLWLVSLVAIAVVMYGLFVNLERVIQPSQRQLQGLALIEPISRAVQALQLHRGLSAALLNGNETMRDRRAAQEKAVTVATRRLEEKLPPDLAASEDYRHIRAEWSLLQQEGLKLTAAGNLAAHTRLIEQMLSFEASVADEYLLTLDTELASNYLINTAIIELPHVFELLGHLRAYGVGILADKQITESRKIELHIMMGELDHALNSLNLHIDKAARYNPAIQKQLMAMRNGIADSVRQVTHFVVLDMLSGHFSQPSVAFLDLATAAIDEIYEQMYQSLLPTATTLIKARIARAENTLFISLGSSLLLFLLVIYLSVCMYYAIISSIQSLARSAHDFANGDLKMRIGHDTDDELSQIGDSFNKMADGFNAILDERKQVELALMENQERLSTVIETAMDAVVQMDAKGIITGWNSRAENIFGLTRAEAIGQELHNTIIPHQFREAHLQGIAHFLSSGKTSLSSRLQLLGLHRDGHEFPVELSITAVNMAGNYEFNSFIRDITMQRESDELIWNQANFDALTGLPNRHMFYDRLAQDIKKAHRAGLKAALLFIDLDKFKEVNDTLGHSMGDILLGEAARRIGECVRETDTVARLGGDEFTVILTEIVDTSNIERVAANILQNLVKPFFLENEIVYISASIGITLYPVDATETEALLKNADQAMYAAKNGGRNRFSYFTQSMQQEAQQRQRMANELRGALAGNQFSIQYQPIVDLASGRISKAEALIRWQHPDLGYISPAQFIPLAEETGLIGEIGDWIFKKSLLQVKRWRSLYHIGFQISVNVSPQQLRGANDQHKTWPGYLRELGLRGQCMVVEITEGLLMDANSDIAGKLLDFHDAGFQVAIDDFGTGYSSLSYLKKFDIDYLKIDQSFVRDMETDPDDIALSEAIIVMAHKLGIKVIAEGLETEAQLKLLSVAGCDYAQGYLFSRPVTAEEFEELLKNQPQEIREI